MGIRDKTFNEIEERYELEIDRIVKTVKKERANKILLQFPEGMKPYAQVICDEIERRANSQCFIWLGSCFGACDVPIEVEKLGVDLIVQFGHSEWNFNRKDVKVVR